MLRETKRMNSSGLGSSSNSWTASPLRSLKVVISSHRAASVAWAAIPGTERGLVRTQASSERKIWNLARVGDKPGGLEKFSPLGQAHDLRGHPGKGCSWSEWSGVPGLVDTWQTLWAEVPGHAVVWCTGPPARWRKTFHLYGTGRYWGDQDGWAGGLGWGPVSRSFSPSTNRHQVLQKSSKSSLGPLLPAPRPRGLP